MLACPANDNNGILIDKWIYMLYYISQRDLYTICIMQTKTMTHSILWYDIISAYELEYHELW